MGRYGVSQRRAARAARFWRSSLRYESRRDPLTGLRQRLRSAIGAAIESFNGRFREECLNVHSFASVEDAKEKIDAFRWDYNENHPHRALKGLSPRESVSERWQPPRTHPRSGPKIRDLS